MKLFTKVQFSLFSHIKVLNNKRRNFYKKFIKIAERRPVSVFLILLGVLLVLIILSNLINKPKESAQEINLQTKEVQVYTIGTSPKITVQAQVEKSGVIKVVALAPGVVQSINVEVGQKVDRGQSIISTSTNYQGGNTFSVQRQLAQVQYKNVSDTYKTNIEIIEKQREIANKSDENSDKLREISNQSIDATQNLLDFNNNFLLSLADQQSQLEASNAGGVNNQAINSIKGLRSQLMSGNSQLEQALKNSRYSGDNNNLPVQISNISKDIALKQLDLQEKALGMNKEISRLSLALAQVGEAMMYPSSPVAGVIERVYVRQGQAVNPGTPLVQISGDSSELIAVAPLSQEMANSLSRVQVSTLRLGSMSYEAVPFYVSSEATDGALYTAEFSIPDLFNQLVTDKGYILVDIPIDFPKTGSAIPFIPIDSVFQTQDQAYLFVVKNGKAKSKKIKLGGVLGSFVEVEGGLSESDQVILNRNVIEGDSVRVSDK